MAGIFEQAGYDAMASTSRITAPERSAAKYEEGVNRTNYMLDISYQGRPDPAEVVKKQVDRKPAADLYQNPVRNLSGEKSTYASLLNYEFMN